MGVIIPTRATPSERAYFQLFANCKWYFCTCCRCGDVAGQRKCQGPISKYAQFM